MFDAYLFQAMFAVQILLISVLIPRRLLRRIHEAMAYTPPDPRGAEPCYSAADCSTSSRQSR